MKDFIKSALFFSFFSILFYACAMLVAGKILPKRFLGNLINENSISARDLSEKRYKDAYKYQSLDVLIIGSSHAYRGYDVRNFTKHGFNSYNLGSSAQPLLLSNSIFKTYIDILKPKKVIIDIYPVLLSNLGTESEINLLPLFYKNTSFVQSSFQTFDIRVLNSLLFFQVFGDINSIKSRKLKGEEYINGGYISSSKIGNASKKYGPSKLKIEEKNITALKSIVESAKAKRIKVFLFQAPLPENRYRSFTNNREIDSLMKTIGNYHNYNDVRFLPSQYFMDDSHINQKGVDVYNKWVIDKIIENE